MIFAVRSQSDLVPPPFIRCFLGSVLESLLQETSHGHIFILFYVFSSIFIIWFNLQVNFYHRHHHYHHHHHHHHYCYYFHFYYYCNSCTSYYKLRCTCHIKEKTQCTIHRISCFQIALQFPDSLLTDSAAVSSLIEKFTGKKVFVLADTSYGR